MMEYRRSPISDHVSAANNVLSSVLYSSGAEFSTSGRRRHCAIRVWIACSVFLMASTRLLLAGDDPQVSPSIGKDTHESVVSQVERERWEKSPKTRDELDTETREKFDHLRTELTTAKEDYETKLAASSARNSLRGVAVKVAQEASAEEATLRSSKNEVDKYFEQLDGSAKDAAYGVYAGMQLSESSRAFRRLLGDETLRPFAVLFCEKFVSNLQAHSANPSGQSTAIQELIETLPANVAGEQAVEVYLKFIDQRRDDKIAKNSESLPAFELPEFVKTYAAASADRQNRFMVASTYADSVTDIEVSKARDKMAEITRQLSEIWPRWLWAETPSDVIREDELRAQGHPLVLEPRVGISRMWTLWGVNLILILVIASLFFSRRIVMRR